MIDWKPIKDAPKDGRRVLLYRKPRDRYAEPFCIGTYHYYYKSEGWSPWFTKNNPPTHYAELTPPDKDSKMTPIERALDAIEWKERAIPPCDAPIDRKADIPIVTHEGVFDFCGFKIKCFQLSNGDRVFDADDIELLMGVTEICPTCRGDGRISRSPY